MISTLTVNCDGEDETVRERTGHQPSYAEAKKMKLLALHTLGCLRVSLRDNFFLSSSKGAHLFTKEDCYLPNIRCFNKCMYNVKCAPVACMANFPAATLVRWHAKG